MKSATWLLLALWTLPLGCRQSLAHPTEATSPLPAVLMDDSEVVSSFSSPAYGIQVFLWWDPFMDGWDEGAPPEELAMVNEMGFGWVKQEFPWREIEGIEKGSYDWFKPDEIVEAVEAAGLQLMVRLDRQPFWSQEPGTRPMRNQPPVNLEDFADFCGTIASRYRGRIGAYQVWNEPNLSREWGDQPPDPVHYTALLKVCYEAIKAADPEAIVISAGLAPTGTDSAVAIPDTDFLQGMYDAGAIENFDVLGVNAPGFKAPPETSPEEAAANQEYGGGRWFAFRHVEDMRAIMVANDDGAKQVAILEMGWTLDQINPDYSWFAVDEETQAEYLVRAYQYAAEHWQPWIGLMTTVYIADPTWTPKDEQWWWAIVLPDGTRRQAFFALRDLAK